MTGWRALVVVAAMFAAACECPPAQVPEPSEGNPSDPPPELEGQTYSKMDSVAQACAWLEHLGCPESKPEGSTCVDSMRTLVSLGTFEEGNVRCIRASRTVAQVRRCAVDCAQ